MSLPSAPTGVYTIAFRNKIEIRWVQNPETVRGYNVYNSMTSGSGVSGYVKLNNTLIEEYSEVRKEIITSNTTVTESGNQRTTTVEETVQDVFVYLYTHENLTEEKKQYYVITAVNELGEEGPYSIEIDGTPLIIDTEIVEEPLRTQADISLDYITNLLQREPKLDVKPGQVTRQLHIDPVSREIAYAYVRTYWGSIKQSFLTLDVFDDADGDRISDSVSTSTDKQLLKEAYFLETDDDTQDMIDFAYDKLAADTNTVRKEPTKSTGIATFYTEVAPTVDMTVNVGEEISTVPTEVEPAVKFVTLSSDTIEVANLNNFFSQARQRWEIQISIEAVEAGASGNVNADTIINTNVGGFQVTNLASTFGGTDEESNANLSDRGQLAFVGLDVGTASGYQKTVAAISSVTGVIIVDAEHPMMQRDYDDVRKKHVYGKVDIYIKGGSLVQQQDTVGFLYKQLIDETFQIINSTDMIIRTSNTSVTISKPIFSVAQIRNVSKGSDYDLTGNWTVQKNAIEMVKIIDVTMDLTLGRMSFVNPLNFGDVITADYDYKADVTGEVIIDPAIGGEVNFTLDYFPVVKNSYTIYKNGVALIETVDYVLTLANGFLQLTSGLAPGDALTADYVYITSVVGEIVISSATGGETTADLDNNNVLESFQIYPDGITIDLEETNVINASIGMDITDVITVTYRYRDSDPIVLLKQPADSIISIESSVGGFLTETVNYTFNDIDDILLEGNSIRAQRSVQIIYGNGIPAGDLLTGTESVVLINNEFTELSRKGIDTESIVVKDQTDTIIYTRNLDYVVQEEEEGENVKIARGITTTIPNGATVNIYYDYGELLTILYNTNPLVEIVQEKIQVVRHVTADVLVKLVLETKVDFEISAVIKSNSDETVVSSAIRTAISNEIFKKRLGEGIAQSDIIRVIEEVIDVESVLVPLTKMVKADGTQISREPILVPFTLYQSSVVNSYTTGPNALLQKTLGSNETNGFYGVFEDDRSLTLVSDANDVDNAAGQAFISSSGEVIISTIDSDSPNAHSYSVSYVVSGETGAKDMVISDLEYLSVGEIVIATAFGQ